MNHMDQVRKRFVLLAAAAVFVLLTVLLTIINGLNFTMAAADADAITARLENRQGTFQRPGLPPNTAPSNVLLPPDSTGTSPDNSTAVPPENSTDSTGSSPANAVSTDSLEGSTDSTGISSEGSTDSTGVPPEGSTVPDGSNPPDGTNPPPDESVPRRGPRVGPMGPDSPETDASVRYFTYAFSTDGSSEVIAFALTAVSEEEAETWADSLRQRQPTGWTRTTYRYRVYTSGEREFVSVIDQGRELLPSLRILIISIVGGLLSVCISYFALLSVSKRLFQPLEEANRKQERFIADVEKDFKVPLTILDADVEIMEKEGGENDRTRSMHRQLRRMTALVRDLSALALFDRSGLEPMQLNLSEFARAAVDGWQKKFTDKGLTLTAELADHVTVYGDGASLSAVLEELLDNALKFAKTSAKLTLSAQENRVELLMTNDTDLPSRTMEEIFDRFTRLENAKDKPGSGLGLSHVREIVRAHNGRASAKTLNGVFTLCIRL